MAMALLPELGDTSMGNNLHATMVNLKKGSAGLNENMKQQT
jgi:hypothetical protein